MEEHVFKIGDYVVYETELIHELATILDERNGKCCISLMPDNGTLLVKNEYLRPATLADWAFAMIEQNIYEPMAKYRFIVLGKDGAYRYYFAREKSLKRKYIFKWFYIPKEIADAISAHYGIAIMKYEQYKKYMEEK